MTAILLCLYKTQRSLIISNVVAAVEASACTSLLTLFLTVHSAGQGSFSFHL